MNVEAIAALAAAGVAAVGIPATLLVGRWQMRAGLRAAEATANAGIAQAEATYQASTAQAGATLEAVRAQASATHDQWRRDVRRETYAAFLRACYPVTEATERIVRANLAETVDEDEATRTADLDGAKTALRAAFLVVELEGPASVAEAAQRLLNHFFTIADEFQRLAALLWATRRLKHMSAANGLDDGPPATEVARRLDRFKRARSRLETAQVWQRLMNDLEGAETEFRLALGGLRGDISDDDYTAFSGLLNIRFPRSADDLQAAKSGLEEAQDDFVSIAREELDATGCT